MNKTEIENKMKEIKNQLYLLSDEIMAANNFEEMTEKINRHTELLDEYFKLDIEYKTILANEISFN